MYYHVLRIVFKVSSIHVVNIIAHLVVVGTPPRIEKSTINFDPLWKQLGDDPITPFSFINENNGLEVYSASLQVIFFFVYHVYVYHIYVGRTNVLPPHSH